MKLLVFGASGGTGSQVVDCAVAKGHQVVAVARRPESVKARDGVVVHKGDVLDASSISGAFKGVDGVISAIGPSSNSNPGTLISEGAKNILAGCAASGVRRLVFESGLMVSDGAELSFLGGLAVRLFRGIYPKLYRDKVLAETSIQATGLDWVIVRPPALKHGPATGNYVAGPKARVFPPNSLSHADCADALVRAASEAAWVKQIVNVGRP